LSKLSLGGFDNYRPYLTFSCSQLKGPPNGGLLFAFRSVQDCNSSGSFAIFDAIRRASSDLILIKLPIESLWFKHKRCTHDDLDNQIRNR